MNIDQKNIDHLNAEFGIQGQVRFVEGQGGLVMIEVENAYATAKISTYSAQVVGFRPGAEGDDLLFVSEQAYFAPGKAIKGGIPICWPWFGPDPSGQGGPGHGFVRARQWRVAGVLSQHDGSTYIRLETEDDETTRRLWPHRFVLELEIQIGRNLLVTLVTRNKNDHPLTISQGLHTYFKVGDIAKTQVSGLDGCAYLDKTEDGARKQQQGPVVIGGEVDRIYLGVERDLVIEDSALDRRIRIESTHSRSAVVWNPWGEKAKAMGDFGDEEYRGMLCVETTNADEDAVQIPAGGEYRLSAEYSVEH